MAEFCRIPKKIRFPSFLLKLTLTEQRKKKEVCLFEQFLLEHLENNTNKLFMVLN